MARTDRQSAPWANRRMRRTLAIDARTGRVPMDPATMAAIRKSTRPSRDHAAETAENGER